MESITHSQHANRKKPTARTSVVVSVIIHVIIFVAGAYWAAHEGVLGKKLQTLSASILDKEKRPEAKKDEPKEEAKKAEAAQEVKAVKAAASAPASEKFVPPPAAADVAAAPPPVTIGGGDFTFSQSDYTDPVIHYKQQIEAALRAKWERPTDVADLTYVAEVEVALDPSGKVLGSEWKKGSGDAKWDASVKQAVANTKAFNRPPPKGFPEKVLVRFDVQKDTEMVINN